MPPARPMRFAMAQLRTSRKPSRSAAERALDRRLPASSPGNGGTRSCKLRELVGKIRGQDVAARREHLAELDEDRAERSSARRNRTRRLAGAFRKNKSAFRARAKRLPRSEPNSSSPKQRATQRILARRSKEVEPAGRSGQFTRIGRRDPGAEPCLLAPLARCGKALDAFVEPGHVVAQPCRRRGKSSPRRRLASTGCSSSSTRPGFRQGAGRLRAATPRRSARLRRDGGATMSPNSLERSSSKSQLRWRKGVHRARQSADPRFQPAFARFVARKKERQGTPG